MGLAPFHPPSYDNGKGKGSNEYENQEKADRGSLCRSSGSDYSACFGSGTGKRREAHRGDPQRGGAFHFYAPMYVAIEEGYFAEEGIDLTLVTGFGADKVMTAVLSGEAQIGFMGAESSVYAFQEGANDAVVNFAQLTQPAGKFSGGKRGDAGFQGGISREKQSWAVEKAACRKWFLSIF